MRRGTEVGVKMVMLWHRRRCWEGARRRWIATGSLSANVCAARVRTAKGDFRPLPEGHRGRKVMWSHAVGREECRLYGSTVGTVESQTAMSNASEKRPLPHAAPTAMGEGVCPRPGDAQGRTGKSNTVPPRTGIAAAVVPCDGEVKHRHHVRVHRRGRRSV